MKKPGYDPGLTEKFAGPVDRIINPDGTFNVRRDGTTWRDFHPYLALTNMSWTAFLSTLFLVFIAVNIVFAAMYFALPDAEIHGGETTGHMSVFLQDLFFSADTFTTLGYGNISPISPRANSIASFEALLGVLGLAVATGLLFGRVSRPSARIGFSDNMLISPYQDGSSLQFRVVNRRRNSIVELEARVMLMLVKTENGETRRTYDVLRLERDRLLFLPLTWTVVHPIDEQSPLWGKTAEDLARMQAEFLILIKGHDDTFNQTVFARRSYRQDEIVWGARFAPAFHVSPEGSLVLELRKVGELAKE
jgi:inward rectifier potassium channel